MDPEMKATVKRMGYKYPPAGYDRNFYWKGYFHYKAATLNVQHQACCANNLKNK